MNMNRKCLFQKVMLISITVVTLILLSSTVGAYNDTTQSYYPKATAPTYLYVISEDNMSVAESAMIVSLQGISDMISPLNKAAFGSRQIRKL
jgi:hypothetical protein